MNSFHSDSKLYQSLMDYALQCLSRRPHSVHELSKKLFRRAQSPEDSKISRSPDKNATENPSGEPLERVIARLTELGYLDDFQFAQRFVEERCRLKPRGKYLLTHELRRKGISKSTIQEFWTRNPFDEIPLAEQWVGKKRARINDLPIPVQQQKLFSFLASKGFSLDTIRDVLDKAKFKP